MKFATLYHRSDGYYLYASSRTTVGVYIASPPYLRLDIDANSEDISKAVKAALEGSQAGVPHPTEWDHLIRPMYELAKVKTWHRFAEDARSVSIESDDDGLRIRPSSKDQRMNFFPISDAGLHLPRDASASEIGDAVKQAIALCG
jgi:hypothetical protein